MAHQVDNLVRHLLRRDGGGVLGDRSALLGVVVRGLDACSSLLFYLVGDICVKDGFVF